MLECLTQMPSERGSVDVSKQYESPPMANKTGVSVMDKGGRHPRAGAEQFYVLGRAKEAPSARL